MQVPRNQLLSRIQQVQVSRVRACGTALCRYRQVQVPQSCRESVVTGAECYRRSLHRARPQEQHIRQQELALRQFEHRLTLGIASCDETCWPPSSARRAVHVSTYCVGTAGASEPQHQPWRVLQKSRPLRFQQTHTRC